MKNFTFQKSYAEAIDDEENGLTETEKARLYRAIMNYVFNGEFPELKGVSKIIFGLIEAEIDREISKKIEQIENGKKGGRPKKPPFLNEETQEKGGFLETKRGVLEIETTKKGGFLENKEKEVPQKEKERSTEKEYLPQEKTSPPVSPQGETKENETDETIEGYLAFMRDHPHIVEDLDNPSYLSGVDFSLLAQKISESSRYLQGKQSLKWLLRHYWEIIGDSYKDFSRDSPSMFEKGELQLWQELVKAINAAKENKFCQAIEDFAPLYRRLDQSANDEMGKIYRELSPEIINYFDPQSFLDLCAMDEKDLKYERARFLRALPEIRKNGGKKCR